MYCQTLFSSKESLDHHLNSRIGGFGFCLEDNTNKPYQCREDRCGRGFTRRWILDRHMREIHHSGERETFTCPREGCDMVFKSSHGLTDHEASFRMI